MKILYIDCGMGAAGDMISAALLDLFEDKNAVLSELNGLGIPGVEFVTEKAKKCGISGTHLRVLVHGAEEAPAPEVHMHSHSHEHEGHDHGHGHHHHGNVKHMEDIEHIVMGHINADISLKTEIMGVYALIADAESKAHGLPVADVHFSEVGRMDAVADVAAACFLMRKLAPDRVIVSPVRTGSGLVKCDHGIVPVPAPATANLLVGVPSYAGDIEGEMLTPTGAALIKHFAGSFGKQPLMTTLTVGYGMGTKDFGIANCVRATLGEAAESGRDEIYEYSCNVDDMTGEEIGFAMDRLFDAGALDVYTIPIGMKKNRPGTLIRFLCKEADLEKVVAAVFKHTTTIGIRGGKLDRYVQQRSFSKTEVDGIEVRRKASSGFGTEKAKFEFDDLAKLALEKNISLFEARKLAEK
ncbi:MAG: nickel pincer cofactor biosynthesis protein LarC [Firmicutes bacterium]|nr:nickel pincer cofactor biosynthesis protein LarC [Bacillota bacterium]